MNKDILGNEKKANFAESADSLAKANKLLEERVHELESKLEALGKEKADTTSAFEKQRQIINRIEDPVLLIGRNTHLIDWNESSSLLLVNLRKNQTLEEILPVEVSVKIFQLLTSDFSNEVHENMEFACNGDYYNAVIKHLKSTHVEDDIFVLHLKKLTQFKQHFNRQLLHETRLRKMYSSDKELVFMINESGIIVMHHGNKGLLGIYDNHCAAGQPVWNCFGSRNKDRISSRIRESISLEAGVIPFEIEVEQDAGISYYFEVTIRNLLTDASFGALAFSAIDITEHRRAKELLSRNEARFKSLIRNITDVISMVNDKGVFTFVSPAFYRTLGYKEFEVIGRSTIDFIHPDDRYSMIKSIRETIRRPGTITTVVCRFRHRFGQYLIVENICHSLLHEPLVQSLVINSRDITERKITEDKLMYNSAMLQNIFDESPDAILLNSISGRKVINCNKKTFELFHISSSEQIVGHKADMLRVDRISDDDDLKIQQLLSAGEVYTREALFKTMTGETFHGMVTLKKIIVNGVPYEMKRVSDISHIKSFENSLKLQQQRHNLHIRQTPLAYIEWSSTLDVSEWNVAAERIFGYNADEIVGKHISLMMPSSLDAKEKDDLIESVKRTGGGKCSFDNLHKDGHLIKCEWYNTPLVNSDGLLVGYTSMIMDVTERYNAEESVRNSLKEKEVLLSEIHHRVKNNLAVVSGLLFLHSESVTDEKLKSVFFESQMRIKSISLIHEKLYQSENFGAINMSQYISDLASSIISSYELSKTQHVKFKLDIDDDEISMNSALTYGLILNELLTNSMKYAFKDQLDPMIFISWKHSHGQEVFVYSDNGPGFNFNSSTTKKGSIGVELVQTLVRQLHGKLDYSNLMGSLFTITVDTK